MDRDPKPRPYHQSGLYTLQNALKRVEPGADWTAGLGPVGEPLRAWRAELIESLGGEGAVSPQQRAIIELAVRTHLMLESVDSYLLAMPSLVNRQKRQLFAVVKERQVLADALTRYLTVLGLERRKREVPTLAEYLEARGPTEADGHDSAEVSPPASDQ